MMTINIDEILDNSKEIVKSGDYSAKNKANLIENIKAAKQSTGADRDKIQMIGNCLEAFLVAQSVPREEQNA